MSSKRSAATGTLFGVSRLTWIVVALTIGWCAALYFMRQPLSPWAFDTPAARGSGERATTPWSSFPWSATYPTSIVDCGNAGPRSCSNYCDKQSRVWYVQCAP